MKGRRKAAFVLSVTDFLFVAGLEILKSATVSLSFRRERFLF